MQSNDLTSALKWRAAIKTYNQEKKLTDAQVKTLLEAMNLAPSSYGLQPYKFYVVSDQETKAKLAEVGYGQPQFTSSSHLIVLASSKKVSDQDVDNYVANVAKTRGVSKEDVAKYAEMIKGSVAGKSAAEVEAWAARQVYIPLGVVMTAAAMHQIDSTPMEGFDVDGVGKLLGITEEGFVPRVIVALGYRAESDAYSKMAKVRKSLTEISREVTAV
jgi:nitroreductase / dihydropteridine reductase